MPRVNHAPEALQLAYPALQPPADSLDLAFVAADTTNDEMTDCTGKEVILAWNVGATPHTVTITSVPVNGRSGDVTGYSVGAGEIAFFGPYPTAGFRRTGAPDAGKIYFEADNAEVEFAVLKLP